MPYGKGTYGSKVGRPPKKKKAVKKKPKKQLDILSKIWYNIPIVYLSILYKLTLTVLILLFTLLIKFLK